MEVKIFIWKNSVTVTASNLSLKVIWIQDRAGPTQCLEEGNLLTNSVHPRSFLHHFRPCQCWRSIWLLIIIIFLKDIWVTESATHYHKLISSREFNQNPPIFRRICRPLGRVAVWSLEVSKWLWLLEWVTWSREIL